MGVSDRVLVGALKMAIASLASLAAEAKGELMTFPSGGWLWWELGREGR